MPRENLTGELAESYVQITYWFSKVYDKNILGLQEVWGRFAGVVTQTTDGGNPDLRFTVVALPESLKPDARLVPTRFANTSSRLVNATGFDLKTTGELTRMLMTVLNRDFGIACLPGEALVREPKTVELAKGSVTKIILVGASNMKRLSAQLTGMGYVTETITMQGGIPSDVVIEQINSELSKQTVGGDTAIVFDLLGNFSFRFVQADGSLALPVMLGGKHHLLGDVETVQEGVLKGLIAKLGGVFSLHKECPKIILPPIPRYIRGSCCEDIGHGNNARDKKGAEDLCAKVANLRKVLKESLVKTTLSGFWVPDIVGELSKEVSGEGGRGDENPFCKDNVHLNSFGLDIVAKKIELGIEKICAKNVVAAALTTAGPEIYYWRGFGSSRGATRSTRTPSTLSWRGRSTRGHGGHQRGRGFHPYHRGGGRR